MKATHPHDGPHRRGVVQALLLAAVAASLVTGCATAPTMTQARYTPRRGLPERAPMKGPLDIRMDFAHPPQATLQSLTWAKGECEWCVDLPASEDACAGVVFRREYNLSDAPEHALVAFKMKPASSARYVVLSLLDEVKTDNGTLRYYNEVSPEASLDTYIVSEQGDWAHLEIPLEAFAAMEGNIEPNWSNIRGFRLSRPPNADAGGRITLTRFAFLHEGRHSPYDYASLR